MKRFEHINFETRKIIVNGLSNGKSAKELGEITSLDPTSVAKEIKRGRYISKEAYRNMEDSICKKTLRYPYVCNICPKKHSCHKNNISITLTKHKREQTLC